MNLISFFALLLVAIVLIAVAVPASIVGPHTISVITQGPFCIADGTTVCGITIRGDATSLPTSGVGITSFEYVLPSVPGYAITYVSTDLPFSDDFFEGFSTDESELSLNPSQRSIVGNQLPVNREGILAELYFTIEPTNSLASNVQTFVSLTSDEDLTYFSIDPTPAIVINGDSYVRLPIIDVSEATFTVVNPDKCPLDLDDDGDISADVPDGAVDINDLLFFLGGYEEGLLAIDVDDGNGDAHPDGAVDINDLLYFLQHFEQGC